MYGSSRIFVVPLNRPTTSKTTINMVDIIETISLNVAVLAISGASAIALGQLLLRVIVKIRRSS